MRLYISRNQRIRTISFSTFLSSPLLSLPLPTILCIRYSSTFSSSFLSQNPKNTQTVDILFRGRHVRNGAPPSLGLFRQAVLRRRQAPARREGGGGSADDGGTAERRGGGGGAFLIAGVRHIAGGGAAVLAAGEGGLQGGGTVDLAGVPRGRVGLHGVEGPIRVEPMDRPTKGLRGVPTPRHHVYSPDCRSRPRPMFGD